MRLVQTILPALLCCAFAGCFQLNIPESSGNQTMQYTLALPSGFKAPETRVSIAEFVSESPAKFKMLSRKGTVLQFDTFSKWTQTPSVMVSSAFRKLYGADNDDFSDTKYILEGDIFTFERNLNSNTADLKVLYRLINRADKKVIFCKELSSSIRLKGNTPEDFAAAMSQAVVDQAEKIKQDISALKKTTLPEGKDKNTVNQ